MRFHRLMIRAFALTLPAVLLLSCSTNNPNAGRALISLTVTPEFADAHN